MQNLQWTPRISVFRQLTTDLFEWYRAASPEEIKATGQHIVVSDILSEQELWERLGEDNE